MPTISEFYGILILIFYDDHVPPHFHARYGEHEALIQIDPHQVLKGGLPPKALQLVKEWAFINHKSLKEEWENAVNHKKLQKIPPLQ